MTQPKNNQEFYNMVDETCLRLCKMGMGDKANQIHHLLYEVAWTSTTELFDALETVFKDILSGANAVKLSQQTRDELNEYLRILDNV
jgi:hypothetical protein